MSGTIFADDLPDVRTGAQGDRLDCISGVVVARVVRVLPHPNGEFIWLAFIDLGDGVERQVVYGGKRKLHPEELVPAAPPGAYVPCKKKMRRRNYRGESSYGMLCSTDELGWTCNGPDEVAVLDPDLLQMGQSLDQCRGPVLPLDRRHGEAAVSLRPTGLRSRKVMLLQVIRQMLRKGSSAQSQRRRVTV